MDVGCPDKLGLSLGCKEVSSDTEGWLEGWLLGISDTEGLIEGWPLGCNERMDDGLPDTEGYWLG